MAKTATLVYDFATDDGTFVDAIAGGTISGGICSMPYTSGSTVKQTAVGWDLTESSLFIELNHTGVHESSESYFGFGAAGGLFDATQLQFVVGGDAGTGYYIVYREINGSAVADDGAGFLDYNPTTMRWLRLTHSGTTVTWDTSPDGSTWTNRRSKTPVFTPSNHRIKLGGFNWQGLGGSNAAEFDNVNGGTPPGEHLAASTTIGVDLGLAGAATMQAGSAATLGLDVGLDGGDTMQATADTELGVDFGLDGTAAMQATSSAPLGVNLGLDGTATAQAAADTDLGLTLGLAGATTKQAASEATFAAELGMSGAATMHGAAASTLGIVLGLSGTAVTAEDLAASTTIGLTLGLSGTAVADVPSIAGITIVDVDGPGTSTPYELTGIGVARAITGVGTGRHAHGPGVATPAAAVGVAAKPAITGPGVDREELTGVGTARAITGVGV